MTHPTPRRAVLSLLLGSAGYLALATVARAQSATPTEAPAAPEPAAEPAPEAVTEPAPESVVAEAPYLLGDLAVGDPDAPVTIYEYISLTCPHCASFHVHTWPSIKRDYVDTGKARFIIREVYFDRLGLWATMAARCGNEAGYHSMIDQFLSKQQVWTRADDVPEEIRKVARLNGVPEARLDECMGDRSYAEALVETFQAQSKEDAVESTPTFIINGERASGNMSAEAFGALIDAHL